MMRGVVVVAVLLAACGGKKKSGGAGGGGADAGAVVAARADAATAAGDAHIAVDPRVELMAIISALAGSPEYTKIAVTPYTKAVLAHFTAHRNHAAVLLMKQLRPRGIGYEKPMQLAAYLDERFEPVRSLVPPPPGMDPMWNPVKMDELLPLVRAFAADAKLNDFLTAQAPLYEKVAQRLRGFFADKPIIPWFDAVFGARTGTHYRLVPGMMTGAFNYGVHAFAEDGSEEVLQIVALERPDDTGVPQPGDETLELAVHELSHSYLNPMLAPHMEALLPLARPVYERVAKAMQALKYASPDIMVNESVVRAVTLLFLRERSTPEHAMRALRQEQQRGFLWMAPLTEGLARLREAGGGRLEAAGVVEVLRAVLAPPAQP